MSWTSESVCACCNQFDVLLLTASPFDGEEVFLCRECIDRFSDEESDSQPGQPAPDMTL
ncbi:CbrC family protein [Pseudomonas chengduensis]|nr:hypothetical protein [Pseudomonas chengduensis]MDH1283777.1 CbrC family protein [Pseudomonas chengduensis]